MPRETDKKRNRECDNIDTNEKDNTPKHKKKMTYSICNNLNEEDSEDHQGQDVRDSVTTGSNANVHDILDLDSSK